MSKEEQEFHAIQSVPWTEPPGGSGASAEGVTEKILNFDPTKNVGSRLLHFEPGSETDEVILPRLLGRGVHLRGWPARQEPEPDLHRRYVCLPAAGHAPRPLHLARWLHHVRGEVLRVGPKPPLEVLVPWIPAFAGMTAWPRLLRRVAAIHNQGRACDEGGLVGG